MQVERTNPFFNDYGEQTVPLSIPASTHNCRLLNHPEEFGNTQKQQLVPCAISDGDYHVNCQQTILSAQRGGSISTSFYMNDGSLYASLSNVKLKSIYGSQVIPGVDTLAQALDFCRGLRNGTNEDYAIFPILTENDGDGLPTGYNFKVLNAFGADKAYMENRTTIFTYFDADRKYDGYQQDFYNAKPRTEVVDSRNLDIAAGYYITPFIRCRKVLTDIFAHFGYALQSSLITSEEPFRSMVFVNTVIDSIIFGTIRIADLVPDVSCLDVLSVFRKKFACEFVPDEETKTVSVKFFRDVANEEATDLSAYMKEWPQFSFVDKTKYKRITLKSSDTTDSDATASYDSLTDLANNCPTAFFDERFGQFRRIGYDGNIKYMEALSANGMPYNTGEDMEEQAIEVPDLMPELRELTYETAVDGKDYKVSLGMYLYCGKYIALNSVITENTEDTYTAEGEGNYEQSNMERGKESEKQKPILAFAYVSDPSGWKRPEGTISAYDLHGPEPSSSGSMPRYREEQSYERLFNYSLFYNGQHGIFSRFYAQMDQYFRNALQPVKVKMLLPKHIVQSLPSTQKVLLRGMNFFIDKVKFTLGGEPQPEYIELRTALFTQPITPTSGITDFLPMNGNRGYWKAKWTTEVVFDYSGDIYMSYPEYERDLKPKKILMPVPSSAYSGQQYAKYRMVWPNYDAHEGQQAPHYTSIVTVWFEVGGVL